MADETSETPKPSWREKSGDRAKPSPPSSSSYEWMQRRLRQESQRKRPLAWMLRIAAAVIGFLALAALAVILILRFQPGPGVALVLVGADYSANLAVPHNIAGIEGLRGLEELTAPRKFTSLIRPASVRVLKKQSSLERAGDWTALIEGVRKSTTLNERETLVVVLALHGASDAEGAYLLPNTATKPEDGLRLNDVIASFKNLPEAMPKLLVLEPADVMSDWSLGVLHNDFASRLKALDSEIAKVSNLWVLCASDVDQRSWTSEGLGRSPFYHFLAEGLRGQAAGPDGRLRLDELVDYVKKHVSGWAWNAREAVQEPILLPTGRSASSQHEVFLATSGEAPSPRKSANVDKAPLIKAWTTFQQLDQLIPHPSVYSPMRWRDYRAALVRFEELTRAGAPDKAALMTPKLAALERRIRSERFRDLPASIGNTLAMNAARGGLVDAPIPAEFNELWTAGSDADATKIWGTLAGARPTSPDDRLPLVRTRVDKFLIERAVESPAANLGEVVDRLRITEGNEFPQPAEAHYVRMARKYLETQRFTPRDWAILGELILLRRRAELSAVSALTGTEKGHSYSAQILGWTSPQIQKADAARREAEDLLFASGEQSRADAARALDQARTAYLQADIIAAKARAALAVRDRLLSVLPEYSHWVAQLPRGSSDSNNEDVASVEALWAKTHELSTLLQNPSAENTEPLLSLATEVGAAFDKLDRRFQSQKTAIDLNRVGDDWKTATAAARVAFSDSEQLPLRRTIWERLDNIQKSDRDLAARSDLALPPKDKQAEPATIARIRSNHEGRVALAALGQVWFNNPRFSSQGDFESLGSGLAKAKSEKVDDWRVTIAKSGTSIGQRWRGLREEIATVTSLDKGIPNLPEARAKLVAVDLYGRMATPTPSTVEDTFREPAGRRRDLLLHDLLKEMASRAWLDHWYDEDPSETPYYQRVGKRYLDDAERLVPGSPELAASRELLKSNVKLGLEGPGPRSVTTEQSLAISYKIVETGSVPPGTPVVRAAENPLFSIAGEGRANRTLPRGQSNQPGQSIGFSVEFPSVREAESTLANARPSRSETVLSVEGFFRGQVFNEPTPLTLDPVSEFVVMGPNPSRPAASLAVRADQAVIDRYGEGTGAITFVLDCSGSMVDPVPSKFAEAKKALLAAMQIVPRGTQVGILTFGQADEGFSKDFPRDQDRENNAQPEKTIRVLRANSPWNTSQLDELTTQLDALRPFHGTPLVQAMARAKRELEPVKGAKTMVVLTDGKDTRFAENKQFNPKGVDVPSFLRSTFLGSDIRINMVFFKVVEDELKEARAQFAGAIEHLDTPGQFFTVADFGKLVTTLQASVRQKLICQLLRAGNGGLVSEIDVTSPGEADRWYTKGLPAGPYTLRVTAGKTFTRGVNLEKGDRLVVNLELGATGGIEFERAVYGDSARSPKEPVGESDDWQLSVLANRARSKSQNLELMVALEPRTTPNLPADSLAPLPGPSALRQVEPGFVWFSLEPTEGQGPFQLRVRETIDYPSAVWRMSVPQWLNNPAGSALDRPVLKAWWLPRKIGYQATVQLEAPLEVDHLQTDADDGSKVTIESIRVEDHLVETTPDAPPETVSALVVRLAYPKGKPFLVGSAKLGADEAERFEQRVFTTSDKTTAIFWPVTRSQVESGLKRLDLIALETVRRQAEQSKDFLQLRLNKPRPEDDLPAPPDAITAP